MLFTSSPADDGDFGARGEKGAGLGEPVACESAVSVDKLDKLNIGIPGLQRCIAGVASARGGEWSAQIKVDNQRAATGRSLRTAVGRAGIRHKRRCTQSPAGI